MAFAHEAPLPPGACPCNLEVYSGVYRNNMQGFRYSTLLLLLAGIDILCAAPVKTLSGQTMNPFSGRSPVVLLFTTNDCPVANKMVPEIRRITRDYNGKARFLMVYTDPQTTPADLKTHRQDYNLTGISGTHDRRHALVQAVGAKITPEAVIVQSGKVVYRGRINNFYEDFGKPRRIITQHDLRDALDAVLAGTPVPKPRGKSIGCYITRLK